MTTEPTSNASIPGVATRPKQRKAELVNATDNEMGKLRKATIKAAMAALLASDEERFHVDAQVAALAELDEGVWRQWLADDRTLDPETVWKPFGAMEEWLIDFDPANFVQGLIAEAGLSYG
jgi:hypothetical protein